MLDRTAIHDTLRSIVDPVLRADIVSLGLVDDVQVTDRYIGIVLGLYAPYAPSERHIVDRIHHAFQEYDREFLVLASPNSTINSIHSRHVRNVVPIVSMDQPIDDRKLVGDVGEGTYAFVVSNLAVAIARTGAKVGVLQIGDCSEDRIPKGEPTPPPAMAVSGPVTVQGVSFARIDSVSHSQTRLVDDTTTDQSEKPGTGAVAIQRSIEAIDWGRLDYLFVHERDGEHRPTDSDLGHSVIGPVLLTQADTEDDTVDRKVAAYSRAGRIPIGVIPVGRTSIIEGETTEESTDSATRPTVTGPTGTGPTVTGPTVTGPTMFPLLRGPFDDKTDWDDVTPGSMGETMATKTTTSGRHLLADIHSLAPQYDAVAAATIEAVGARQRRQHAGLLSTQ